jgi:hypothetical protein
MSRQRPSQHLTSEFFNVLPDVCVSGTYRYQGQADSARIAHVITPALDPTFRRFKIHRGPKVHILRTNSFDQHPGTIENH